MNTRLCTDNYHYLYSITSCRTIDNKKDDFYTVLTNHNFSRVIKNYNLGNDTLKLFDY